MALRSAMDFEMFRPMLATIHDKERASDSKTIWMFREQIKDAQLIESLFNLFESHLRESSFAARGLGGLGVF